MTSTARLTAGQCHVVVSGSGSTYHGANRSCRQAAHTRSWLRRRSQTPQAHTSCIQTCMGVTLAVRDTVLMILIDQCPYSKVHHSHGHQGTLNLVIEDTVQNAQVKVVSASTATLRVALLHHAHQHRCKPTNTQTDPQTNSYAGKVA